MNALLEENKDYKIIVKDSLCACSGETSVINKALKLVELNYSFEELNEKLDEIISAQEHIFTVTNLEYLYRVEDYLRLKGNGIIIEHKTCNERR